MKSQVTLVIPVFGEDLIDIANNAVKSILLQSGNIHCDIIISNNGGNKKVRDYFKSRQQFSNILYIESPTYLPMSKHFEYASSFANSEYMMILPARRMLRQGSLLKMISVMTGHPECDICCGGYDEWDEQHSRLIFSRNSVKFGVIETGKLIDNFLGDSYNSRSDFWRSHPTAMNGIVKTSFVNKLRGLYGDEYFNELFPDISSGFKCLMNASHVYLIEDSIFITTNRSVSTGNKAILSFDNKYFDELGEGGVFRHMPSGLNGSIYAGIIEDYNRQKASHALLSNSSSNETELSKFFLKESAFEFFLKLFNSPISMKNLKTVYVACKTLNQLNVSYLTLLRKLLFALIATLYLKSPNSLRFYILIFRGKSMNFKDVFKAAGFID